MMALSDAMPRAEGTAPACGSAPVAARDDHVHQRLSSSQRVTLDANSQASVTYTRSFAAKPGIVPCPINPSGRSVQVEVVSDTIVGGLYVGCVIKGYRSQALPALTLLLTSVVSALSGFDALGASAAGVEVSVVAVQAS